MTLASAPFPSLQLIRARVEWPFRVDLGGGLFSLVDKEDVDFLSQWKWGVVTSSHGGRQYARRARRIGKKHQQIMMHRFLMHPPAGHVVDHANGDTLDNRKGNLRVCTQFENATSRKFKVPISGYRGVVPYSKDGKKFRAQICAYGTWYSVCGFDDPMKAARAYDVMARKYKGEFAVVNFPGEAQ